MAAVAVVSLHGLEPRGGAAEGGWVATHFAPDISFSSRERREKEQEPKHKEKDNKTAPSGTGLRHRAEVYVTVTILPEPNHFSTVR